MLITATTQMDLQNIMLSERSPAGEYMLVDNIYTVLSRGCHLCPAYGISVP